MLDTKTMPHLADIARVQSELRPSEVAFWFEGEETTFAELNSRANQVSNGLLALGATADQRVGYLAKNTAVYYEMLYGCAKARAVMNGVNTRLAAPEVQFILSDAQIRVLFVGPEWFGMIEDIIDDAQRMCEGRQYSELYFRDLSALSAIRLTNLLEWKTSSVPGEVSSAKTGSNLLPGRASPTSYLTALVPSSVAWIVSSLQSKHLHLLLHHTG